MGLDVPLAGGLYGVRTAHPSNRKENATMANKETKRIKVVRKPTVPADSVCLCPCGCGGAK